MGHHGGSKDHYASCDYSYSSEQTYEFTAISAESLIDQGTMGSKVGCGDTFIMPADADTCITASDDDGYLSGDNCSNENANDSSGQTATIQTNGVATGNGGQIYAESYFWVTDTHGNTYLMVEIEQEGSSDKYYAFHDDYGMPPVGAELTIGSQCNVTSDWVDYDSLTGGEKCAANTPPEFTNFPEYGEICIEENATYVINLDSSDADGDARTYSISGGADSSAFVIDERTGELSFVAAPDYEAATDADGNNVYEVEIKVSDDQGGTQTKLLKVCVEDVAEGGGECIVIEAEDMHETGFKTVSGSQASGGELLRLKGAGGDGEIWTTFNGEDGEYDLKLFIQDESDGQSSVTVLVNGVAVGNVELDRDSDGGGSNNGGFSEFVVENLQIDKGDVVTLVVDGDGGEYVRLDKIELCKDGEPCPDGFTVEDFNALARGTFVSDQLEGVTITAQRSGDGAGSANDAMIFDSANTTGGDSDLGFDNQGKILIISEDGDSSDPDDNYRGGTITFDFDNPSDLHDIKVLDIEESGGTIDLYDADGALIKSVAIPAAGDNSIQTVLLDASGVASMDINLVGSGAVDDLCWKPGEAPDPGSLSGRYFIDENFNDVDDGEPGVEGVLVELLDADGNPTGVTTTTDANGEYSFDGWRRAPTGSSSPTPFRARRWLRRMSAAMTRSTAMRPTSAVACR